MQELQKYQSRFETLLNESVIEDLLVRGWYQVDSHFCDQKIQTHHMLQIKTQTPMNLFPNPPHQLIKTRRLHLRITMMRFPSLRKSLPLSIEPSYLRRFRIR